MGNERNSGTHGPDDQHAGRLPRERNVTMGYWDDDDLTDPKIQEFLKVRPDGVGFNMIARVCAFLEYTRPMDSRDGASEQPD